MLKQLESSLGKCLKLTGQMMRMSVTQQFKSLFLVMVPQCRFWHLILDTNKVEIQRLSKEDEVIDRKAQRLDWQRPLTSVTKEKPSNGYS